MRSLGLILPALALFAGTSGVFAAPGENAASLCARTAKDGNVEACRAAVAADRRDLTNRENLALAYLSLGDDEDCFQTHAEIVALAPDEGHSHFAYAAALTTFGRYDDAVPFIRTALQLSPDDLTTVQLAALLFEMTSHNDEAVAAFHRGAELGDALLMYDLALAYARGLDGAPDRVAAREWFERAAQAGHVTAMLRVSDMYRNGDGVPVDLARAEQWAARARREGMAD
jgi:TPR repeat protein